MTDYERHSLSVLSSILVGQSLSVSLLQRLPGEKSNEVTEYLKAVTGILQNVNSYIAASESAPSGAAADASEPSSSDSSS